MKHELKTWKPYFDAVASEDKRFEIRLNDRDFKENDFLLLKEYNQYKEEYTGREIHAHVKYVLYGGQFGIEPGYCVMSIGSLTYNY